MAGGANVLCFTTGRGSAYGCKADALDQDRDHPEIYHKMIDDMDINGGEVLEGSSLEAKGKEIFDKILAGVGAKVEVRAPRLWRQRVRPRHIGATV